MLILGAFSLSLFILALGFGTVVEKKTRKYQLVVVGFLTVTLIGLLSSFIYSFCVQNERAIILLGSASVMNMFAIYAFAYLLKAKQ